MASGLVLASIILYDAYTEHRREVRRGQRRDLLKELASVIMQNSPPPPPFLAGREGDGLRLYESKTRDERGELCDSKIWRCEWSFDS